MRPAGRLRVYSPRPKRAPHSLTIKLFCLNLCPVPANTRRAPSWRFYSKVRSPAAHGQDHFPTA